MQSHTGLSVVVFVALVGAFLFVGVATLMTPDAAGSSDAAVPASLDCSGDEVHPPDDFHPWSQMPRAFGYHLEVNESTVEPGDPIRFTLTNDANRSKAASGETSYALQRPSAAGWETINSFRGAPVDFDETEETVAPGEGYNWTFRANATGFSTAPYVVCESLEPGIYRFVYTGGEHPTGVRFEIEPRSTAATQGTP